MGILCLLSVAAALDFKYHHDKEMEAYLKGVHAAYPSLTHLHSIGRSVEGRGFGYGGKDFCFAEVVTSVGNSGCGGVSCALAGGGSALIASAE